MRGEPHRAAERIGVSDGGQFLSRAIVTGVPAGVAAAIWGALYAGLAALPWWSPLALYGTHMWGLSQQEIVAKGLTTAVVAGLVWLAMLGMVVGAIFGLLAGVAAPPRASRRLMCAVGFLFGLVLFGLAEDAGVALLPPSFQDRLPIWVGAVALGIIGGVIGGWATAIPRPD